MAEDRFSWDDLRYLEALGRLGTAGRAARELGASASTVYRRIAQLEQALGTSCIRTGDSRLTDTGEAMARVARQTDQALTEITQRVRTNDSALAGEVSLTTVDGIIPFVAAPLNTLMQEHPDLSLRLVVDDQGPSVRRGEVDLAIGVMPSPPEALWGRKLFRIRYRVFGTQEAVDRQPRRWLISGNAQRSSTRANWEAQHADDIVVRTDSVPTMMRLLHEGLGVGILPDQLGGLDPSLVELSEYRDSLAELERNAWLLTHPDLRDVPRVRAVMDALVEAFTENEQFD